MSRKTWKKRLSFLRTLGITAVWERTRERLSSHVMTEELSSKDSQVVFSLPLLEGFRSTWSSMMITIPVEGERDKYDRARNVWGKRNIKTIQQSTAVKKEGKKLYFNFKSSIGYQSLFLLYIGQCILPGHEFLSSLRLGKQHTLKVKNRNEEKDWRVEVTHETCITCHLGITIKREGIRRWDIIIIS